MIFRLAVCRFFQYSGIGVICQSPLLICHSHSRDPKLFLRTSLFKNKDISYKHDIQVRRTGSDDNNKSSNNIPRLTAAHIKKFLKKYGYTGFIIYVSIYGISFVGIFLSLQYRVTKLHTIHKLIKKSRITRSIPLNPKSKYHNLALAWCTTKIIEPIRLILTIGITSLIKDIKH